MSSHHTQGIETKVLPVDLTRIGKFSAFQPEHDFLDDVNIELDQTSIDAQHVRSAARQLQTSNVPVAFPTETVYGLGADATRGEAVRGIYKAKQRPADNPLIVHVASLQQLRAMLQPPETGGSDHAADTTTTDDPIPSIYKAVIEKFWPGPLTILLPNPKNSLLAPEVTAGLSTFGARMPRHALALALIKLADRPIAAPSANASTKPSPTAAEHVAFDLDGRIETILDGGPCDVGVESTVVDGLSSPPLILRPGGVSLEQLRQCPGWENTEIGYKDTSEKDSRPRAPGMKYRHYSPKATVVLFEAGTALPTFTDIHNQAGSSGRIGIVRTKTWQIQHHEVSCDNDKVGIEDMELGADTTDIARGIFSALRDLDRKEVDAIFVEGIDEHEGDVAAAVMNRLRKAAEIRIGD
ncbi:translation factor [Polychaeton citri CBS 116435]|uniref:Threonylcarbamoyl-AMP synthase n=1 Tax=Polychaeton citri CBS 116435 TaxID=1314669 RepID=A0A9P4QEN9_9PEZI|nr:translation factor [Polychaeton citri CBS 116435]